MDSKKRRNEDIGYIQGISPKKVSKKGFPWFEFHLQTSEKDCKRIVAFNEQSYSKISEFEKTKSPVKILFDKEDKSFFTNQSSIQEAKLYDVGFPYQEMKLDNMPTYEESTAVSISDIAQFQSNTSSIYTIHGKVYIGKDEPKSVKDLNGTEHKVKEDCLLADGSGDIPFHVWGSLIDSLGDKKKYRLASLLLKRYRGKVFVTTSYATQYEEIENLDLDDDNCEREKTAEHNYP